MVSVLATAQRQPASTAQTTRWGACRTSAPIAAVPRSRAGGLHRAKNPPIPRASEITTGERPRVPILVGASAAPSQAPAVKPLAIPASCSRPRRRASSGGGEAGASGSTTAPAGRRSGRQRVPKAGGRGAWWRAASQGLLGEVAGRKLPRSNLAQRRRLRAAARVLLGVRAAGVERAAGRRVRRRRYVAHQHDALALRLGGRHRHGGEQRRGIRMAGTGVEGGRPPPAP